MCESAFSVTSLDTESVHFLTVCLFVTCDSYNKQGYCQLYNICRLVFPCRHSVFTVRYELKLDIECKGKGSPITGLDRP